MKRVLDHHVGRLILVTLSVIAGAAAALWSQLPKQDPASYFNFANQEMYLGIPNFSDVVSNLLFIYVGLWGMLHVFSSLWIRRPKGIMVTLFFVNLGLFLVGWGSSYFHMMPNATSLFWDRAPMAAMFMAVVFLILSDRAPSPWWQVLLLPAMALGVWTAWQGSFGMMDIRYYIVLQFGGLLFIAVLMLMRKALYLNNRLMIAALVFYILAKLFEVGDHYILEQWGISGHTLKHMVAALAALLVNLAVRVPVRHRF